MKAQELVKKFAAEIAEIQKDRITLASIEADRPKWDAENYPDDYDIWFEKAGNAELSLQIDESHLSEILWEALDDIPFAATRKKTANKFYELAQLNAVE